MNVIFWDVETNGLEKYHSVLSISAIKASFSIEEEKIDSSITERYERFYFRKPGEEVGKEAIAVNGLTDKVIRKHRTGVDYPEHFSDDIEPFRLFCSDTRHFVGHNIFYDRQYINFWLHNVFCTMIGNTGIIRLKKPNGKSKYPSLVETAKFYGIEIDKDKLHGSMYDSYVTYLVFNKMLENERAREKVKHFFNQKMSLTKEQYYVKLGHKEIINMLTVDQCEKIKQLGEKEKEISKEIISCIKSDKEGVFPVVDGIINIENYVMADYKTLWLLKEPWGIWDKDKEPGKPKLGGGSFPDWYNKITLNELEKRELLAAKRIMEVTATILKKPEGKLEVFKSIAYVNIKKIPIDGDVRKTSNKKELQKAYDKHKDIVIKQIETYCPDIVICGNTLQYLSDDNYFDKTNRIPPIRYNQYCHYLTKDRLWINWHHPSDKPKSVKFLLEYKRRITSAVKDWEDFKKGMSK